MASTDQEVQEFRQILYEPDPNYDAPAYQVVGWRGIAWDVLGWELEPDENTEWTGCYERTGNLVVVMVGDDRPFTVDPGGLSPLSEDDFCSECGQIIACRKGE